MHEPSFFHFCVVCGYETEHSDPGHRICCNDFGYCVDCGARMHRPWQRLEEEPHPAPGKRWRCAGCSEKLARECEAICEASIGPSIYE